MIKHWLSVGKGSETRENPHLDLDAGDRHRCRKADGDAALSLALEGGHALLAAQPQRLRVVGGRARQG
jgi:hypothetical protein